MLARNTMFLACSRLSASGDDPKSGRGTTGCTRSRSSRAAFSIVPTDQESGTGYNVPDADVQASNTVK